MMKIVINVGVGIFSLNSELLKILYENNIKGIYKLDNKDFYWIDHSEFRRDDQKAINLIEQFGVEQASGDFCVVEIVSIPDDIKRWDLVICEEGYENIVYGDYKWYGE